MVAAREQLLQALQLDKAGDWDAAHRIVQRLDSVAACWIHAYLHREEGDLGNARYWYNRAGKPFPTMGLQEEWAVLNDYVKDE